MTAAGWLRTQATRAWDAVKRWWHGQGPKDGGGTGTGTTSGRGIRFPWWLPMLAVACGLPTAPTSPVEPMWAAAFREAEACSGRAGDLALIRWHVVPDSAPVMEYGRLAGHTAGHDIYLARSWAGVRWIARHESLHALGFHHHDRALFGDRCHALWDDAVDTLNGVG